MRRHPLTLVAAAVVAAVIALPAARGRAQQAPPRDGAAAPVPLRLVRGVVRAADDSVAVLRRARITVIGWQTAPVFTDQEGRFEVAVPAAAPAALRVTKPGFAPAQAISPAGSGDVLDVRVPRGAAISGRVADGLGGPVAGVEVRVRRVADPKRDQNVVAHLADTDDLGEFRVGSLPEGDYEVVIEASRGAGAAAPGQGSAGVLLSGAAPAAARARAAGEPQPTLVRVGPGDEAAVALFHGGRTSEEESAAAYVAGYEAGTNAALKSDPRRLVQSRGSGTITGRVTGPDGRGLSAALVRLTPISGAGVHRVAASSSSGAFQFNSLPAGSYRVAASRSGFMPGEHGQQRAAQPGRIVSVRDRQRLDQVDVSLLRGAVVTGTVSDPDGEPLEGLAVHVWRLQYRGGRRVAEAVADVVARRTDDRGRYRLYGLQPGAYYVVAADAPGASPRVRRGVTSAPRSYYPGTPSLWEAATIHVDAGVDAPGIDMAFRPASTVRVTGVAQDSSGGPLRQPLLLVGSTRTGIVALPAQAASMSGLRFEFEHVVPGEYVLQAIQRPPAEAFQAAAEKGYDTPSSEFAMQFVNVGDTDVANLLVITSRGSTVAGRIVVEEEAVTRGRGAAVISVASADPDYAPLPSEPRPWTVQVNPDWTFRIDGLHGLLRFTATPQAPPGWWLKRVEIGGVNVADDPLMFRGIDGSRGLVDVVFSTSGANISGRVVEGGNEVGSYVVIVLPDDRSRWYAGSRYIKVARPGEGGRFSIDTLPPGDYWVIAVEAFDDASLEDPEVLNDVRLRGRRLTLSPGAQLTTDISLARVIP